jgi:UDP-2,3-diacylglucosamine pyrophosphatase LpxH
MSSRLVAVSDLHLAGAGPLNNFHAGEELTALIQHITSPQTTLVFGGDGFDLLQLPDRPESLRMADAPALFAKTLEAIKQEPWGPALFEALRKLLEVGGRWVILPGNHDPELFHPGARQVLLQAVGVSSDGALLEVHRSEAPWRTTVGRWQVELGHGHRRDAWNDIDPAELARGLETDEPVTLPPGSRLVLKVLNRFKEARNPATGAPRFPFVDLLKPETPAVPLLLLYLAPRMAMPAVAEALKLPPGMLSAKVRIHLREGEPVLAGRRSTSALPGDEALARAIALGFSEEERSVPEACVRRLERWLEGTAAPVPGTLAAHGGGRFLLRAFLRAFSSDGTFFEPSKPDAHDRALIDDYLAPRAGPRVLITGHTHAAREVTLDGERVYLNTGTWTDLMKVPRFDDDQAVQKFAEALEAGSVPRLRQLRYAEVTSEGPRLQSWPPGPEQGSSAGLR